MSLGLSVRKKTRRMSCLGRKKILMMRLGRQVSATNIFRDGDNFDGETCAVSESVNRCYTPRPPKGGERKVARSEAKNRRRIVRSNCMCTIKRITIFYCARNFLFGL